MKKFLIPWAKPSLPKQGEKYLRDVFCSTWFSGGAYVSRFEKEFTRLHRGKYGLAVSNGTTALQLALLAFNIKPGDEVIVPAYTFVAPVNMVLDRGAKAVYADVDPLTWCLDPNSVEQKITKKTKAIIAVHTYGNVCEMDALIRLAKDRNIFLIEDAAEAAFSKYKGRYTGTWGDAGCFSFQSAKTLSMGEGGFVFTKNRREYEKMLLLRDHGMNKQKKYWHECVGYNFRMTNFQAAVGCAQLEEINQNILRRNKILKTYKSYLEGEKGLMLQVFQKSVKPVVWALGVRINSKEFKLSRDRIIQKLFQKGIEARPGFYPLSAMKFYCAPKLPVAKEIAASIICLPFYPSLTDENISLICKEFLSLRK